MPSVRQLALRPMQAFLKNIVLLFTHTHTHTLRPIRPSHVHSTGVWLGRYAGMVGMESAWAPGTPPPIRG